MSIITRRATLALPAAAMAAPAYAQQNFPSRPIRMIVPWGAGGSASPSSWTIAPGPAACSAPSRC